MENKASGFLGGIEWKTVAAAVVITFVLLLLLGRRA